jgi:endonuclease-3
MTKEAKTIEIYERLIRNYPEAKCSLDYGKPFQLLIATQLSAQSTDARVNIVTKSLFKKYKSLKAFANADLHELEQDIRSTGFYHNKAKNIIASAKMILEKFNGEVPPKLEELLELPGVGRKTANVVLGDIFEIPGIIVDTHTKRLSNRIGLSKNQDPTKIEFDLMKIVPKDKWTMFSHMLVFHGRNICHARNPQCPVCIINNLCKYYQSIQ